MVTPSQPTIAADDGSKPARTRASCSEPVSRSNGTYRTVGGTGRPAAAMRCRRRRAMAVGVAVQPGAEEHVLPEAGGGHPGLRTATAAQRLSTGTGQDRVRAVGPVVTDQFGGLVTEQRLGERSRTDLSDSAR